MKILQVVPYFRPAWSFGGPVRCVYETSRELVERGHEVTVATTNALNSKVDFEVSRRQYFVSGVRIRYFKNLAHLGGLYLSSNMIHAFKHEIQNHDIVHMHEYRTLQNVFAHYYAEKLKRPYVLMGHGTIPIMVEKFATKRLFDKVWGSRILKDASKLIASSSIEMEQFVSAGAQKDKVVIVPNGIDVESFEKLPAPGTFKKKFGLDTDSKIVLYIGRLHRRKGIGFLLDAFSGVKDVNAVLVIAGSDDGYMTALKEKAGRLGILEKVLFTGFVSEHIKLAAFCDSKVVVYPGIYESFPIVPLEAALCSKPVIVSDDSVMGEIVAQGGFGVPVRYGNVAQLRDTMSGILENARIAYVMGRKGREFVMKNYDWRDIVSRLEAVYFDALVAI